MPEPGEKEKRIMAALQLLWPDDKIHVAHLYRQAEDSNRDPGMADTLAAYFAVQRATVALFLTRHGGSTAILNLLDMRA